MDAYQIKYDLIKAFVVVLLNNLLEPLPWMMKYKNIWLQYKKNMYIDKLGNIYIYIYI